MNNENELMKTAACALVIRDDGKILAVSRGDGREDWGLPGGKTECGEHVPETAARELFEETGVTGLMSEGVFTAMAHTRLCTTYLFTSMLFPEELGGTLPDFEGHVEWVEPDVLTRGSFGAYNTALLTHLNLIPPPRRPVAGAGGWRAGA